MPRARKVILESPGPMVRKEPMVQQEQPVPLARKVILESPVSMVRMVRMVPMV